MSRKLLALFCSFLALALDVRAQDANPAAGTNATLEERLRQAQVRETRTSSGAVFQEIKFAGSLQPNFILDCITMSDVTSQMNPPALHLAGKKCIRAKEYAKAWALIMTADGFAYYDVTRLADRSARGARGVLSMTVYGDLTDEERAAYTNKSSELLQDPRHVPAYCAALSKVGPPAYEPLWAILHGIGAYSEQEPRSGHYLTNVDAKALWDEVVRNRCNPKWYEPSPR